MAPLFTLLGAFWLLVTTEFPGNRQQRGVAYLGMALNMSLLITIGTLLAPMAWLAVTFMFFLGVAVTLAGVASATMSAGQRAILLSYVWLRQITARYVVRVTARATLSFQAAATRLVRRDNSPETAMITARNFGTALDHTLCAILNDLLVCARDARTRIGRLLSATWENVLPLFTGGQVVQTDMVACRLGFARRPSQLPHDDSSDEAESSGRCSTGGQ